MPQNKKKQIISLLYGYAQFQTSQNILLCFLFAGDGVAERGGKRREGSREDPQKCSIPQNTITHSKPNLFPACFPDELIMISA